MCVCSAEAVIEASVRCQTDTLLQLLSTPVFDPARDPTLSTTTTTFAHTTHTNTHNSVQAPTDTTHGGHTGASGGGGDGGQKGGLRTAYSHLSVTLPMESKQSLSHGDSAVVGGQLLSHRSLGWAGEGGEVDVGEGAGERDPKTMPPLSTLKVSRHISVDTYNNIQWYVHLHTT